MAANEALSGWASQMEADQEEEESKLASREAIIMSLLNA
jgi:hypothetical protein